MMRWNECGVVRTDVGATDPDLLCAPPACFRVTGGSISARCIASTDSADTVELTASAASIARTFPLTIDALRLLGELNSASASDRAPTVRFSICDEAALSDRSRIELIGANSVDEPSR